MSYKFEKTDFWGIISVIGIVIQLLPKNIFPNSFFEWLPIIKWVTLVIVAIWGFLSIKKSKTWQSYLCVLLFGVLLTLNLYPHITSKIESKTQRIVVLLPWSSSKSQAALEDGKLQLEGVIDFITKNEDKTKNFHFVFIDHKNDTTFAIKKVKEELSKGTKYFYSTMSTVNECLSNHFINDKEFEKNNSILVCAVTSSPDVKTKKNKVYRYYVRSNEEGDVLAKKGKENTDIKDATAIVVGDAYGKSAAESFKKRWEETLGYNFHEFGTLPKDADETKIKEFINSQKSKFPQSPRAVLICHYGNGIVHTVKALKSLNLIDNNTMLLFTSTANNERWKEAIKHIVENQKGHYYALPDYKYPPNTAINYNDDVKDFAHFAMEKYILSINGLEKQNDFDACWWNNKVPEHILSTEAYKENGQADIGVPMKVEEFKFEKKK
ncbi:hypothetical protein FACS189413_09680 [Bacteroidia bacterium]|nr:hypothetical protein FACS189413_09680 [Bacteroidia bacterium]